MQGAMYNIWIPLEIGDVIQGNKSDINYRVLDIQHTYSMKERNVVDVSLILENVITNEENKFAYDYDTWKIIKYNK